MRKQPVTAQLISAFFFAILIVQCLFYLMQSFKLLALLYDCTAWFVSDLVGNPNCWLLVFLHRLILKHINFFYNFLPKTILRINMSDGYIQTFARIR